MYIQIWQLECIEKCFYEQYGSAANDNDFLTNEQIENKIAAEISSLENSGNYARLNAFVQKSKTVPTKGMERDLKILNGIRKYFAYLNGTEFSPLERAKFKFNRILLENELKENRHIIRDYRPCSPRQQEILVNLGLQEDIAEILPMCRYSDVYDELKQDNEFKNLFYDSKQEEARQEALDPDEREKRKFDDDEYNLEF